MELYNHVQQWSRRNCSRSLQLLQIDQLSRWWYSFKWVLFQPIFWWCFLHPNKLFCSLICTKWITLLWNQVFLSPTTVVYSTVKFCVLAVLYVLEWMRKLWTSFYYLCLLSASQLHDWIFLLLLEMQQNLRVQVLCVMICPDSGWITMHLSTVYRYILLARSLSYVQTKWQGKWRRWKQRRTELDPPHNLSW
jgi:hypothetical protein